MLKRKTNHCAGMTVLVSIIVGWLMLSAVETTSAQDTWQRSERLEFDVSNGKWVSIAPPQPGTAEGDLYGTQQLINDGQYSKAIKMLEKWEKEYGDADPFYPAALIAKSQALIGDREYYKAHQTLQVFLNAFEGTALTQEALRQEFVIAEVFLGGTKRKIWGMRLLNSEDIGLRILDDISAYYAGEQIAEYALKTKGAYFTRDGAHELAEMEYARLINEYPNSRYYADALLQSARSAIATYRGTPYDDAALIEARQRYQEYEKRYPQQASEIGTARELETIRQERATKQFSIGQYYEKTGHMRSAIFYYRNVVQNWPETTAEALAIRRLEALKILEQPEENQPDDNS